MNLRCYIVEDSVYSNFTVPIDSGNNVEALQQLIKTAVSRFEHIGAHRLQLHQVNVPARNLEDELKHVKWNLPLNATAKISEVFRDPDPDNVHVVVMPDNVVIRCLVLGETAHAIFEIDISPSGSVDALKEAVKKRKGITFKDTESANIQLFKVSLPIDDALPRKLADLDITNLHELSPIEKISQPLQYPFDNNLHIVVCPPSFLLHCLVSGDTPADIFEIDIPPNQSVAALEVKVKEEISDRNITTFALYLADIHANTLPANQPVQPPLAGQPLNGASEIWAVFPIRRRNRIHVIVAP